MLHTWSSEHRRRSRARSICFEWPHRGAAGSADVNYRAESYGPFKLPIENQLYQEWRRRFLSLHFLFKDLTQYQE